MFIILGADGHIGKPIALELLEAEESVTVVLHTGKTKADWEAKGAIAAVVDVNDKEALKTIYKTGKRAFVLNPPAPVSSDTEEVEKKSATAIAEALMDAGLEKVVAQSTYGAQPGEGIGDLSVLHEFEGKLLASPTPATIQRGAYYMSNWDGSLETATKEGVVYSFYPADFSLPMVAPADLAHSAVQSLKEAANGVGIHHVEGPKEYTPQNVADAFSKALNKDVRVEVIPSEKWKQTLQAAGFSDVAAESMVKMTTLTLQSAERLESPKRGTTTLEEYVNQLVNKAPENK